MQIRIAGVGGQGVILAGVILGEAASIEGLNVVQSQDYSAESRGGVSIADVIVSPDPIYDLTVTDADVLVALAQNAYENNKGVLKEDGLLIVDTDIVKPDRNFFGAPFTKVSARANIQASFNMVVLGYLVKITQMVKASSIERVILNRTPKGTERVNLEAFRLGFNIH